MLKYLFLKLQVEKNGQFCLLSIFYCHYKSLLYQTVKKKRKTGESQSGLHVPRNPVHVQMTELCSHVMSQYSPRVQSLSCFNAVKVL